MLQSRALWEEYLGVASLVRIAQMPSQPSCSLNTGQPGSDGNDHPMFLILRCTLQDEALQDEEQWHTVSHKKRQRVTRAQAMQQPFKRRKVRH